MKVGFKTIPILFLISSLVVAGDFEESRKAMFAGDYKTAKIKIEQAAKKGHAEAQCEMGRRYRIEQKYVDALKYYKMAEKKDNACSKRELGIMYENGFGVNQDGQKAIEYFIDACKKKDILGCSFVGDMYASGENIQQNFEKAHEYYQKIWFPISKSGGSPYICGGLNKINSLEKFGSKMQENCNKGNASQCEELGRIYACQIEELNSLENIRIEVQKMCENGIPYQCEALENIDHKLQKNDIASYSKSIEKLYSKSCELGNCKACSALISMYKEGVYLSQNKFRALQISKQQCEKSDVD